MCHSTSSFPASGFGRGDLLGELYVSPNRTWMTWTGHYRPGRDERRNQLPGPRQLQDGGPGTTWRAVPRDGVQHECRAGKHRMVLTEAELWSLVRPLPADATVLFLPATQGEKVDGSDGGWVTQVVNQGRNERGLSNERRAFSTSAVKVVATEGTADR